MLQHCTRCERKMGLVESRVERVISADPTRCGRCNADVSKLLLEWDRDFQDAIADGNLDRNEWHKLRSWLDEYRISEYEAARYVRRRSVQLVQRVYRDSLIDGYLPADDVEHLEWLMRTLHVADGVPEVARAVGWQPARETTRLETAPATSRPTPLLAKLIVGGVVAIILAAVASSLDGLGTSAVTSTAPDVYRRTIRPLTSYGDIDVRELDKSPDQYAGQLIHLHGEVFNINESGGGTFLQMNVRKPGGSAYETLPVMVSYDGALPGIYEDSQIDVYGVGAGAQSGTNAFGGEIDQPLVFADIVQ